jgi:excisionase family DNA binding protein
MSLTAHVEELLQDGLEDIKEAVRFLSLSRSKVYQLMDSGQLTYVQFGRARRIPRRALLDLAASHLVPAQSK